MASSTSKKSVSVSLEKNILERIDDVPGVKRSTLLNDLAEDWLDENGF